MNALSLTRVTFREHETFLKSFSDGPKHHKGKLFLSLELPDNPGAEDVLAEKIWRALHDSFFNCGSDDQYFCFEEALKGANDVLDQENKKRQSGTIGRLNAITCLFDVDGDNLHFAQCGKAVVYLKRGDFFSQISEEPQQEEEASFNTIFSGSLLPHDLIVFSTRYLPFDQATLLSTFSQQESKIAGQLKLLAKRKEVVGLVSYGMVSGTAQEEVPQGGIKEEPEARERKHIALKKLKEKAKETFSALVKRIRPEKLEKMKKTVSAVAGGVGSRLSKLVKKPDRLREVNRRYVLIGIIGLIILLGILITVQSSYREKAEQGKYFEELLVQVKNNISVAEQRSLIGEKADAVELLGKAEARLQEIASAGFFQSDVEKLQKQIVLYRDRFDEIFRVENPHIFADISQKGTVDTLGIIHTADQKNFIYEPRRLFETILDKVQEPLSIDPEEIVLSGSELEDFNVLSFITQNGQVIEYSMRNGRFERSSTQDDTWKKGVDVKTFNGEFLYILDPSSNTIWKYRRLRNAYSGSSVYTTQGDISNAVSLAIDGDIYVLLRDGTILKYRKGQQLPFEIKDQPSVPLNSPTRIFTLAEHKNMYVLDSNNRRVVVYVKGTTGSTKYLRQYFFSNFKPGDIRDFYVDKEEQKLVVLSSEKVYITDL